MNFREMYIGIYTEKTSDQRCWKHRRNLGYSIETDTPGGSGSLTAKDQTYTLERHHAPMVKHHGNAFLSVGRLVTIPEAVV